MSEVSNSQATGGQPLHDALRERGFSFADDVDDEVADLLREVFPLSDSGVSFRNVIERKCGPARLLVGVVSTEHSCQTVAYFESDQLTLPSFTLQPNDLGIKLFSKLVGVAPIRFESCPEFSGEYDLSATHPEHAQLLFGDVLLTYFVLHPGLQVQSDDNRLIAFRPDRRFEGGELEEFIRQAEEVFTLFQESAADYRTRLAETAPVDPNRAAQEMGGLAGALVRRHLVTRQDVDAFLAVPAPRPIPSNIRRRRLGTFSGMTALAGVLFVVFGILNGVIGGVLTGGPWNEQRLVPLITGLVSLIIGLLAAFFALRYRFRNKRLLRHGILAPATIESIEATEDYVGYERQYRARFRLDTGGGEWMADCKLDGSAARKARQFAKAEVTVRVLYDPNYPKRILWVESLITASTDYDQPKRPVSPADVSY